MNARMHPISGDLPELALTLFEESGEALFLLDAGEHFMTANPAALRLAACSAEELRQRRLADLFRAEADSLERLRAALRQGSSLDAPAGFALRQGEKAWRAMALAARPLAGGQMLLLVRDPAAGPEAERRHARDLAEHRRVEEMLRQSEKKYRDLVETSHDLIWAVDLQGRWTFVNRKAAWEIYGCEAEEMLGRPFTNFATPERARHDLEIFAWIKAGEPVYHYETIHRRKDGSLVHLRVNAMPLRDDAGRVVGATGTATDITQRKLTEQALEETRQRFEAFMDRMPLLAFLRDADGRMVYLNRTYAETMRRPREDFLGKDEFETYPPEIAAPLRRNSDMVFAAGRPLELREHVPTPDGKMREWWVLKFPFRDAQGRPLLGCIAFDLTHRQALEQAVRVSEERYRLLFEHNFAGVFRSRLDGHFLDCNESFVRMLGFKSREEALQHNALDLYVDAGDRAEILEQLRRRSLLTDREVRLRRADGSIIWILGNISLLEQPAELEGTIIDITARKQAEEALQASEAKYRTLVDNLDQAVFLKDRALRYVTANPTFCRQFGCVEPELRGKTDRDLLPADVAEQHQQADLVVLREGRATLVEERLPLGGRPRTLRISRTPVRDEAGEVVAVLGTGWDVTEQLALEAQLRHVQKMDAVGQLAGGIAHDFNNLLTAILGNLSLILGGETDPKATRAALESAEQATVRAAELTRTLLGFARRTPLQTVPLALPQAVDETLRLARPSLAPNVELETEFPEDLWPVEADASQVNQVLMNLTLNARDAMPQGGRLRYEAANFVPTEEYLSTHVEARPGEYVRLRVQDTGTGMPAEVRQRIFEPFFTTKAKGQGTGLGLAMVFSIVKHHKGWVECQSEPGRGTTFELFLPHSHQQPAAPAPRPAVAAARPGHETVLVVDDDAAVRQLARNVLTRAGYQVLAAADGEKAVHVYRLLHHQIALVILDSVMPRLSGRDTLEALARINPQVRVLFSTGYSTEQQTVETFSQVAGYLPKPYRAEDLVQKVREVLDQGGGQ